jgi:hypothetical protein
MAVAAVAVTFSKAGALLRMLLLLQEEALVVAPAPDLVQSAMMTWTKNKWHLPQVVLAKYKIHR